MTSQPEVRTSINAWSDSETGRAGLQARVLMLVKVLHVKKISTFRCNEATSLHEMQGEIRRRCVFFNRWKLNADVDVTEASHKYFSLE